MPTEGVFGGDVQPPAPLATAILQASSTYNVPPDVLAGIWRVETNRTYPNPYHNAEGYGGLFGTANYTASPQAQADTAASILSNWLQAYHGNIQEALSKYSGGGGVVPPPSGYSSVPGEVTFGTWNSATTPGGGASSQTPGVGGGGSSGSGAPAQTTSSSGFDPTFGLGTDVTDSVKEFFLRVAELAVGVFLIWKGVGAATSSLNARNVPGGIMANARQTQAAADTSTFQSEPATQPAAPPEEVVVIEPDEATARQRDAYRRALAEAESA